MASWEPLDVWTVPHVLRLIVFKVFFFFLITVTKDITPQKGITKTLDDLKYCSDFEYVYLVPFYVYTVQVSLSQHGKACMH